MTSPQRTLVTNNLATLFASGSNITAAELRQGLEQLLSYAEQCVNLQTGDNGVYDIAAFGAKGDGVTDDTQAFRDALAVIATRGSAATIRLQPRTYVLNLAVDANGNQLALPDRGFQTTGAAAGQGLPIRFVSETPVNFTNGGYLPNVPVQKTGAILYSTLTGTGNVIGAYGSYTNNLTNVDFSMERVTVRTKDGSGMSGLNLSNCATYQLRDVVVDKDVNGYYCSLPQIGTYGIVGVETSSDPNNYCLNTLVVGYRTGYRFGEHTAGTQIQAYCCYNGIEFTQADHDSSLGRVCLQWCRNGLVTSTGLHRVTIQTLDVENIHIDGKWYNNGPGDGGFHILDPNNYLLGGCYYNVVTSKVGRDNKNFFKSDGAYFTCVDGERFPIAPSGSSSASPATGSGSSPYTMQVYPAPTGNNSTAAIQPNSDVTYSNQLATDGKGGFHLQGAWNDENSTVYINGAGKYSQGDPNAGSDNARPAYTIVPRNRYMDIYMPTFATGSLLNVRVNDVLVATQVDTSTSTTHNAYLFATIDLGADWASLNTNGYVVKIANASPDQGKVLTLNAVVFRAS